MNVQFYKAHGAGNDFLFTFANESPVELERRPALARAICERNTGVGADGWYLIETGVEGADARIHLYNSDGSKAELSGNGTRCAAAILYRLGLTGTRVRILTGDGVKDLRWKSQAGSEYRFEMDMGRPRVTRAGMRFRLALEQEEREVALIDVGNPQCAVAVESLDFDWRRLGAGIEGHPRFPNRTNVSFVRAVDAHTIEARFYERGAGPTLSSGTGSTGAAVAAILWGMASSPLAVRGERHPLEVRWEGASALSSFDGEPPIEEWGSICLTGPAQVVAQGHFSW